ncbi:uncharacterized protein LOC122043027 [Zingiber officinale]|uniref:uncharacterized protein LOC122043027 n=1 Tax=Zingiber officinale TaxID=94328 RepID=UPI001C4B5DB6|nr:uncharacterized protein LOC122043027 [Zingiber officinale]
MAEVKKTLGNGEIFNDRGLNQESELKKAEYVVEDGSHSEQKAEVVGLLESLETFNFAFTLHLLKNILGVTNEISQIFCHDIIIPDMNEVRVLKGRSRRKALVVTNLHYYKVVEIMTLGNQLDNYFMDMNSTKEFANLKGIGSLARKLVETRRDIVYPLVYKLIKLALVLPVTTTIVERAFSAMKIVKNRLRN